MPDKKTKIGLVLCQCGGNISGVVDLEAAADWARKQGVTLLGSHDLLCSPDGKKYLEDFLKKNKPDFLVVAACSPRQHEITFRNVALAASLNIGKLQMANIREHCAWVTPDKQQATAKAIALIRAAMARCVRNENLEPRSMECLTDVVVIGGGLAGMEAALLASGAGRKVTLVEKNISLGGHVIQVEELAPNMECGPCLLSPRLFKIKDDPNIRVMANAELQDITGFYGNFTVKVRQKARYVNDSCIGCEACFEACPVAVKSEFHLNMGDRKAIHILFPGAVPAAAAIDRAHCLHFTEQGCDACAKACPFGSVQFDDQDRQEEIHAGAVILATGFESFNPSGLENLGYGRIEDVVTLPEFERISNSNGPYQGVLKLKNGSKPESVAVIHCAGSLSEKSLPYCSGICCMLAIKVGDVVRKQNPGAKVYNLHDRLVFRGPEQERFFHHQAKEGTVFLRTDLDSVNLSRENGKIKVTATGVEPLTVDMVVLATGLAAPAHHKALAEMLGLDLTAEGFFKSDHFYLRSMGTSLDGIYAVGGCLGACDAREAVVQAQAAAGEAVSRLVPGRKIDLEMATCAVNEAACAGCKMCVSVCPYHAAGYNPDKGVSEINQAICRGCGTCAANCPAGAIRATHFTREQIQAEMEGILKDE